ncbi:MAG: peptidyl-tRNA hydrolase [Candidatus Aenigmarchaeota archaeon]|nr:peptidyl-tRNA hydrolase [Candidatus Aenigmarchaeota archaeon]
MYKQVIILRKDVGMDKGKMIAHAIHAAIDSMRDTDDEIVKKWDKEGSKKVVLKINSEKEFDKVQSQLKKAKLPFVIIKDAGKTQLKRGTITAIGIGPIEEKKVDKVTGKLKLL